MINHNDLPTLQEVEAERERLKKQKNYRKALMSTIYTLIIVASFAVLIATLALPVLQISGNSMNPTLKDEDVIILIKTKSFESGDLCAFNYENKILVKRIIATPGDYVYIDDDGNVFVNDVLLNENYIIEKSKGNSDIEYPLQVPENRYFVMGDDRSVSIDSRLSLIGTIEKEKMIGKVFLRIWPIKHVNLIK